MFKLLIMFGKNRDQGEPVRPATPAEAFDGCPNRAIDTANAASARRITLTCPKYPTGTILNYERITDEHDRDAVARQLGCFGCNYNKVDFKEANRTELMERLHPTIADECSKLFESEHYPEAAIKGFMTVKERLRELTGYESSTDAFGKGGLHIDGASAEHVDPDFQQAAKFLLMSIDMFRNEGVHNKFGSATGSQRSYEFLALSSLAMNLLETPDQPEGTIVQFPNLT